MKTAIVTMMVLAIGASSVLAQTSGSGQGSGTGTTGTTPGGTSGSSTTGTNTRDSDQAPPLKGANSFTEGEAKSRAEARGFSDVKDLKKDGDGIWRGHATQQGKSVEIAIDYKGNVVPTTQQ